MTTALRFAAGLAPQPAGAVALRFGGAPAADPPVAPIEVPALGAVLCVQARAAWRPATPADACIAAAAWRGASAGAAVSAAAWRRAAGQAAVVDARWARAVSQAAVSRAPWQRASAQAAAVAMPMRAASSARAAAQVPWGKGAVLLTVAQAPWQRAAVLGRLMQAAWRGGRLVAVTAGAPFHSGGLRQVQWGAQWRDGTRVWSEGAPWSLPSAPPVPAPCYTPPAASQVALRFSAVLDGLTRLVFACRRALAVVRVPIREVYMISNTVSLERLSDGASIPTLGVSLSLDVGSWAWGFSATLPADALALVEPPAPGEPCVLQATINGTPVRVAVESISRERVFGTASVRISGRGISAALADPYWPVGVFSNAGAALTAQQLLDQALPTGWDAEWGLTAWSVPAGVWSHQGTPITAALAIAAAGGGYIQPHNTLQRLRVLPLYPVAPWDWATATPDLELPSAVTQREGIEWVERARYNRVYVSGVNVGVLGRITRAGTAGDVVAPLITDALTTHVDAARQRGLAVLADTGRQAHVTLRLPVLAETGLIVPGKLIRYTDGATTRFGISRSLSVEQGRGALWQMVKLETHVEA